MCTSRATLRVGSKLTSWLLCESCAMDALENPSMAASALRMPSYVRCNTATHLSPPPPMPYVPTPTSYIPTPHTTD